MARRQGFPDVYVKLEYGHAYVQAFNLVAHYKPRFWFLQLNPRLVLPGLRKDQRKKLYVNNKRYGFAEQRHGCIPLPPYVKEGRQLRVRLYNFIRVRLGLLCKPFERDYYWISLKSQKYIVLKHVTEEGNVRCVVYHVASQSNVGSFVFDKEFMNIYPSLGVDSPINTLLVIMGYLSEENVYSSVAKTLNRTLKVKYN